MDKALKQRLVGASVLILLAVIVLPMLLSGQSETLQQESVRIEVPDRPPELTFETRRFPVGEVPPGAPSTLPVAEDAPPAAPETAPDEGSAEPPAGDAGAGDGVVIAASPPPRTLEEGAPPAVDEPLVTPVDEPAGSPPGEAVAQVDTTPVESAPVDVARAPAPSRGRYLVQVASYTISANADNLASRLGALDMAVLRDTVETDANRYHRVRVGPFDDAAAAEAAIAEITHEISDLEPRVVDLKPDEAGPVTNPGDPLVRWVVQAGSFSSDANADKLVADLRAAGFEAYREKVSEASTTLFKVRIGPELRRETAVEVAARLERETAIRGLVMSTD